jgi:uncharacterized protein YbcV (DUF1398 family)
MDAAKIAVIQDCASRSIAGTITFPEVVHALTGIGVERYHADYSRHEIAYYMPNGESLIVATPHSPEPIAETFSPKAVEAAIRQSQRGEIVYTEFLQKTMAAGCVDYFVQITGRRVLYFGRNGDLHLEPFPSAQ